MEENNMLCESCKITMIYLSMAELTSFNIKRVLND